MKFTLNRSQFLKSLQQVAGALGAKPSLPILGNILLQVQEGELLMTCTDLEVELVAKIALDDDIQAGAITVPSRKFLDICRGLPEEANITFTLDDNRLIIRSGRSRFALATLPAEDYPNIEDWQTALAFSLPQAKLKQLIERTAFAMANQDVRYFLNGMLFQTEGTRLRVVSSDGHRMAVASLELDSEMPTQQVIVPRKGILELQRLLDRPQENVTIQIGASNLRAVVNQFIFTSKLIDGRFPDYNRVMPQNADKQMLVDGMALRQALSRAAILTNEKFRGVRLNLSQNLLRISSNNPEQEEAEEFLDVEYFDADLEIGFNVNYLIDVLNTLKAEKVRFSLSDAAVSTLIESHDDGADDAAYVVMPTRL